MLDIQLIRAHPSRIEAQLKTRGVTADIPTLLELDERRKAAQRRLDEAFFERNMRAKEIAAAKAAGQSEAVTSSQISSSQLIAQAKAELEALAHALEEQLAALPNLPDNSVPVGRTASDNVVQRVWREVPQFSFTVRDHVAIGELHGGISFAQGSALSGSRFAVLRGSIARLHRALAQFMLDLHVNQHGYEEVSPPCIVRKELLYGVGQLPKFSEDLFHVQPITSSGPAFCLIPTAEVPLTGLVAKQQIERTQLPYRWVAHTPCFRAEAGSYGRDTRGLIRMHQFEKVELVQIACPDQSDSALEEMTRHAEAVLQALELPYQVVLLCTGDMGFAASKTYDLEVWMPGQQMYREISSCSNVRTFQARRLDARLKRLPGEKQIQFVHTLNGSGVAVGRALAAILENYQTVTGDVKIPEVLRPYLHHCSYLSELARPTGKGSK